MTITTSTPPASATTEPTGAGASADATDMDAGRHGNLAPPGSEPVRFEDSVVLSKREVFGACQALADADRSLLRSGAKSEASALGDLFELLEARLSQ
ncbi:MAG TPA: hypothetical protein VNV87_01990 [Acidimicrobiales bacterium]|jgi:hypothetical protein|nr:hypothetical protein [Acidimicrobiales bacterium]